MSTFSDQHEDLDSSEESYYVRKTTIGDDRFDQVSLNFHELDVMALMNITKSPKAGAVSTFIGTTRDNFEDKEVTHLEYEAYPEMALSCMNDMCGKIRGKWDVMNIVIEHKLGPCPILDTSIAIIVSSAHRVASLSAVEFAINELKTTVPIWKKELYSSGDGTWKSNKTDAILAPKLDV